MREILFRGKNVDNGAWVYGSFIPDMLEVFCITDIDGFIKPFSLNKEELTEVRVERSTIGQFTGLTDKNGTKIFEGDIVHWKKVPYFVRWDSKKAEFVFANDMEADYFVVGFNEHTTMKFCKVVGNIHDNPELLKE